MQFEWPIIKMWTKGWTAVDAGPDGGWVGVSVRCGARPQVLKCAHSPQGGAEALAELGRRVAVSGFSYTLPLQRGAYQLLAIPEPPVLASEMERSLRWTLGAMVDFPIDEANVAWMRIPTTEYQPNRAKNLYAIVSRRSVLKEQTDLFQKARLSLRAIDVRETAQRNIAALLEKKGEGLGLLSVGPAGMTITFTFGGELYLDRFIELTADEMAGADAAEQQKIFERIALQVLRSVDFISRNFPFMPVARLVLAPLPAAMAELRDYLAKNLSLQVEALDLEAVFDISHTPELRLHENQVRYFMALGAALRGMGKKP